MRKVATVLLVLTATLALASSAEAYRVEWRSFAFWDNAAHWPSFPIRYIIRSQHISAAWRSGVESMMREWEWPVNRDETNIVWWSRRYNTTRWRPRNDGDNHITWIWQRDNYRDVRGVNDATARGILGTERTYYSWSSPWHITESDIFFNAAYQNFTTSTGSVCGTNSRVLLQRVALHELGHMIGLRHSNVGTAIMAASMGCSDVRMILQRDDINGLDYLYEADDPIHGYDPW